MYTTWCHGFDMRGLPYGKSLIVVRVTRQLSCSFLVTTCAFSASEHGAVRSRHMVIPRIRTCKLSHSVRACNNDTAVRRGGEPLACIERGDIAWAQVSRPGFVF